MSSDIGSVPDLKWSNYFHIPGGDKLQDSQFQHNT